MSAKEAEARRIAEQCFAWSSEDDRDDFYRWANRKIRELNNCSKTSEVQLQYARDTMSTMFDKIDAQKEVSFHETMAESSLKMLGNYGLTYHSSKGTEEISLLNIQTHLCQTPNTVL